MRAIGPPLTAEESAALIRLCRSQINVRFRHMGRNERGFDCAGLLMWAMQQLGRPVVDIAAYGREPHKDGMRANLIANLGAAVPSDAMRAGDVLLMAFTGEPRHVALVSNHPQGGLQIIHTHARVKKVTEHRLDAYWASCISEIYRP
jgi:cell wall-associated NlpC family hydrolase